MTTTRSVRVEPASLLPLHWGYYPSRYVAGLALLISSTVGLQGANTYTLFLLGLSTLAHAAGWIVLPARGPRRAWVVAPNVAVVWILLTGPGTTWALVVPFLCWLLIRQRPALSYLAVLPVLAMGWVVSHVFQEYRGMPYALGLMAVAVIGSAWLARWIAGIGRAPRIPRPLRANAQ
ncbi:hypothetical protein [Glaciihabitans sp. dw_435]|uniref:hypothetical protein n=1 Tax=Glaciihabitans sp. dw_435 TaxID=2720081 RepID=UPI001BD1EB1F|nr:hypothetical protein [Glaciihabitans sp. dw_435]